MVTEIKSLISLKRLVQNINRSRSQWKLGKIILSDFPGEMDIEIELEIEVTSV